MPDIAEWARLPLAAAAAAVGTGVRVDLTLGGRTPRSAPQPRPCPSAPYTNPITCGTDGREHRVTDWDFHEGQTIGNYTAVCGHVVEPLPMAEPAGPPCPDCLRRPAPRRQRASRATA